MAELKRVYVSHMAEALAPYQDPSGMPRHVTMAVDEDGHGPAAGGDVRRVACWCPDQYCWLNKGLRQQEVLMLRWAAQVFKETGDGNMALALHQDADKIVRDYGL